MKRYTLKIGESAKVRSNWLASYALTYAGMPNPSTYSVAVSWSCGHNSMAFNLFLSERQREFHAAKGKILVQRVSPEEIDFAYQG